MQSVFVWFIKSLKIHLYWGTLLEYLETNLQKASFFFSLFVLTQL